jgi:hypothetical protein
MIIDLSWPSLQNPMLKVQSKSQEFLLEEGQLCSSAGSADRGGGGRRKWSQLGGS